MEKSREYFRVHAWLIYWHGRASKCENNDCKFKNPKRYEWAQIHYKPLKKSIDSFMQLCCSCHRKYDYTEQQRINISKAKKGVPAKNKRAVILNGSDCYESITQASEKTGIKITSIHNNLSGLSKKTKLGTWKYQQPN